MVSFWPFLKFSSAIFSLFLVVSLAGGCATTTPKVETQMEMPFIDKLSLWKSPSRLKGANVWQRRVDTGITPPYTFANLQRLRRLGASYVHLSIPGIYREDPPYAADTAAIESLDKWVENAAQADLKIVIAFRTGPGRPEESFQAAQTKIPDALWTNETAKTAWVQMWKATAERYSARAHVVGFELMVEPNPEDSGQKASVWSQLSERLVKSVRSVDPHIPILLTPTGYASIDQMDQLTGLAAGSVLSIHFYEPYAYTHSEKSPPRPFTPAEIRRRLAKVETFARERGVPFAITEFGVKRWVPGATAYLKELVLAFDSFGASHAVWLWETDEKLNYDDFNFRFGERKASKREAPNNGLLRALRDTWSAHSSR